MQLVLLSDIHDQVWNLQAALAALPPADALLCCGDLCSPFVVGLLAEGFADRPIHIVFGNNDGDLYRITQQAARFPTVRLHGALFEADLDGRRVAMNHYPEIARAIAAAGTHDLVCYGHNHLVAVERLGRTLLVNPGTLMGYEPGGRCGVTPTLAMYDTASGEATLYDLAQADAGDAPRSRLAPRR